LPDAGRVIAGSARGIRIAAPGEGTRPLGDRVKQTLFAILDPSIRGARVLDLYAGSGAGGIEALSRGAARAVFVERDRDAVGVIRDNLRRTHLEDRARVVRADALGWLAAQGPPVDPWTIVLVDPPYADEPALGRSLEALGRPGVMAPDGWVVAKHFWRTALPASVGLLASARERRFGETALTFFRVAGDEEDG
jgi:16S rRNA (guanine(966)-N(2))-methyltransferase RsmD